MPTSGHRRPARIACGLAAALGALALGALAASAPARPPAASRAAREQRGAFPGVYARLASGSDFPLGVVWTAWPTAMQVARSLPAGAASAGRTEWRCRLTSHGRLTACRLQAEWPQGQGFARAARPLLARFVARPPGPRMAPGDQEVIFEVSLETPALRAEDIPGACPPPFCTAVIPPPAPRPLN